MPDAAPVTYLLTTSAEQRTYYNATATTYDEEFAKATRYDYPARVAHVFMAVAGAADTLIVDIGCGTGLLGQALARLRSDVIIDGLDLSTGMLALARATGAYRRVREADLQVGVPDLRATYGAIVSSGTFTLGHLGLEALEPVIDLGRPSALFVLGVNRRHFQTQDFPVALDRLVGRGQIGGWHSIRVPIYGDPLPVDDIRCAEVVVFRKAARGTSGD